MKTKLRISLFACIAAIALGAGSIVFSQNTHNASPNIPVEEVVFANYYYNFIGQPGEEDDESLWELIDEETFNNSTCDAVKNGCVIKTISSETSAPEHPAFVPVTGEGAAMTPVEDGINVVTAKLKNL